MSKYGSIIEELERTRHTYEMNTFKKPSLWHRTRWHKLLGSDDASSSGRSSGRTSIQHRARRLATTVLRSVGSEVLLLVLLLLSQEKLARLDAPTFVQALQTWWSDASHPQALTVIASELFATYGLGTGITAAQSSVDLSPTEQHTMTAQQSPVDFLDPTEQHTRAALEDSIHLAAQSIPSLEDRKAWIATALAHVQLLERLSCPVDKGSNGLVAFLPDLDDMKAWIGDRLYRGVQASHMRKGESRFTRALPLYLARDQGEDFVLEVWMCSSHGRAIAEEMRRMTSVEDWKPILENYLYTAMKTSKTRKIEEGAGHLRTNAVKLFFPNGDYYDSKLQVKMAFAFGSQLLSKY